MNPTQVVEASGDPFTIVEWKDVGIGNAKRISYKIQLHRGFTEQELLALTKQVVSNHVQREEVNAIVVNFINPDGGPGSRYDTAIVWAPNGEWGDAFKVDTGDYSQHKYVVNWYTKYETPVDPELDASAKSSSVSRSRPRLGREKRRTLNIHRMLIMPRSGFQSGQI